MRIQEIICEETITENRMVWRKSGNRVVKGVRCSGGPRKGRVVSSGSQCAAPLNIKKKFQLKKTKAKMGQRMARKARRSKRINPASKKLARMNRQFRKKR